MAKIEQKPAASGREALEEITFLRQQCGSLSMRGRYVECAKLIEDNLARAYLAERWPENFFSFIKPYQRCFPALNRSGDFEEYLASLLAKAGIPPIFASFFHSPPDSWSGEYFRKKTLELRQAKHPIQALDWCDLAIKVEPAVSNLYLLRGWILEDLERDKDAIEAFEHALELNESNHKASQGLVRQYAASNLRKALEYVEASMEKHPDQAELLGEKASVLLKMGKRDEAALWYDKAAEMDPYNASFVYEKAEILLADGKEMPAIPMYKRAVALNEKHVPSLMRLANLYMKNQPVQALEAVDTVVRQEPENIDAGMLRASLLSRLGDNPAAIKQYEIILDLDESNADALSGIALCMLSRDVKAAMEYLDKAIAASPSRVPLYIGRATAYERLERFEEAIAEYKTITGMDKKNHTSLFRLGVLHLDLDKAAALSYFGKALAIAPEEAEYHGERGRLLLLLERRQEAMDSMNTACKYDPGNAAYHFELALLLEEFGNRASAIKNYLEAVSLNPSMAAAHRRLAEMLQYSEPETALYHIDGAIRLNVANHEHYFLRSRILLRLKDDERALGVIRRKVEDGDEFIGIAHDEIQDLIVGKAVSLALASLSRALELSPEDFSYLCFRAYLLYLLGQQGKAMEQYQALLKKDKDNHEALFGVGRILSAKKDPKALDYFDKAIEITPDIAQYHAAKAAFLARDPDMYGEAIACYDIAIPLDKWNFEPILEKSRLLDSHDDLFAAIANYRRVLLVNPNCLEATRRLGELLCDLRPDAAWHYIVHAMRLHPDDWRLMVRAARVLTSQNKPERAEEMWNGAIELANRSAEVYLELARVFARVYPDIALRFGKQVVAMDPKSGEANYLCGSICLAKEELDEAQAYFAASAALGYKEGGAMEKAVELLYLQGRPEALEAAQSLPQTPSGIILKARILSDLADPPKTAEVFDLFAGAVKTFPDDLPLREAYLACLKRRRAFLRIPVEMARLESLRKRLQRERDAVVRVEEITFESEAEQESSD